MINTGEERVKMISLFYCSKTQNSAACKPANTRSAHPLLASAWPREWILSQYKLMVALQDRYTDTMNYTHVCNFFVKQVCVAESGEENKTFSQYLTRNIHRQLKADLSNLRIFQITSYRCTYLHHTCKVYKRRSKEQARKTVRLFRCMQYNQ